jgi:DNA-binding response OmpR family regulator
MNKPCLLIYVEDISLRPLIEEMADAQNLYVQFATQGDQLAQLAKTFAPFMMILDLSGLNSEWLFRHIGSIRHAQPNFPIVGLIASGQDEVGDRAEKYGCNQILTKSEFAKKAPGIIKRFSIGGY